MKRVLCIGSINMDLVINTPRIPTLGETLAGGGFTTVPGGKGANQALAAARMGCPVSFIGAVGNDVYGKTMLKNLADAKVDTSGIEVLDTTSGVAVILVCEGDNCIVLDGGANALVSREMIDRHIDLMEKSDIVLFQFEIDSDTTFYAMKRAKELGKMVVFNPAPMRKFDVEMLNFVDLFVPNQHEAGSLLNREILGVDDGLIAARDICRLGAKQVIITLGKDGCVYSENGTTRHQCAFEVKAVDSTAAGDSFIGGLCRGFCCDRAVSESVLFASATSALVITRPGASSSIPYANEVLEFMGREG